MLGSVSAPPFEIESIETSPVWTYDMYLKSYRAKNIKNGIVSRRQGNEII